MTMYNEHISTTYNYHMSTTYNGHVNGVGASYLFAIKCNKSLSAVRSMKFDMTSCLVIDLKSLSKTTDMAHMHDDVHRRRRLANHAE